MYLVHKPPRLFISDREIRHLESTPTSLTLSEP